MEEWMTAWLGPALDQMDEGQREAFAQAAARISALYPADQQMQDEATEALSAALQVILGEVLVSEIGAAYRAARAANDLARVRAVGAVIGADAAQLDSMTRLAVASGLARDTVAKVVYWGK